MFPEAVALAAGTDVVVMRRVKKMKQLRQENIAYLVAWSLLFAAPLLSLYVRTIGDTDVSFNWTEVIFVWKKFAVFLLLFLVHNFLLAPLLVYRQRRFAYFSLLVLLIGVFAICQCSSRPEMPSGPPQLEMTGRNFPEPPDRPENLDKSSRRPGELPSKRLNGHLPRHPNGQPPKRPNDFRPVDAPPPIVGERDILSVVMLLLMFGANLGVKGWFRSLDDRRRLAELEKQNLEQQLEYLRYQINPHFFMNTLNNIHALVDIDPAKAQETIVELSKMMRFVLYEGDKYGVPLAKETAFIRTYVKLMQLRYTDNVRITLKLPTELPDRSIPPLLLISFVENAFKHGVSYQHESFIDIRVATEGDNLLFECCNSKADLHAPTTSHQTPTQGGVGLANVRKRLDLLYGSSYTLRIHDDDGVFSVKLDIPLKQ